MAVARRKLSLDGARARSWLPTWSAPAAMRAVRATVVVPGLFALADQGFGNLQMATFAAFGGFATLVLAAFAGTRRDKLIAHAMLAVAGSVLLTIGTAVNSSVVLAALVTAPVTFVVFFCGVAGPNAASGVTAALLAYVLPAASPGTVAMIPDRLAGWWLASVAGTVAVLLLSPPAGGDRVRGAASKLAIALADEIEAMLAGQATEALLAACVEAKRELLTQFNATPFRPTGLATADQAVGNAVELLEWCTSSLIDCVRERDDLSDAAPTDRALFVAVAAVLRDAGRLFGGGDARPDLDALEQCRTRSMALLRQVAPGSEEFAAQARLSFHADTLAVSILAVGADALVATGRVDQETLDEARTRWFRGSTIALGGERRLASAFRFAGIAVRHASVRSVWFINSARGALALAAAVAVADLSSVQHGFWVVLGTLSVLRSNAAATGSTAYRALLGTAIGFAIGGVLLLAIGSDTAVLWIALPIAVFVAAYAPGTAPFAVGQAAFTVTVAVLFNLLVPVGWKVGVVRIEDVAIGCAVSVLTGVLFWPRGVSAVVGDDLADAYRAGASYLAQAVAWVHGRRPQEPTAGLAAFTAGVRVDDALRGFLAEQGAKRMRKEELWRLVGGTLRLRLTAHAIAALAPDPRPPGDTARAVDRRAEILEAWYQQLAAQLGRPRGRAVATLTAPNFDGDGLGRASPTHCAIWLREHFDHLAEHLCELIQPAAHIAEIRRRPWWR